MSLLESTGSPSTDGATRDEGDKVKETARKSGDSTDDPSSTSSPSNPSLSSLPSPPGSPFDTLPDETLSHILEYYEPSTNFGNEAEADLDPILVLSKRFRRLATPFRYRELYFSELSIDHILRRPWALALVRDIEHRFYTPSTPFIPAILALFTNVRSLILGVPEEEDVGPLPHKIELSLTDTLRGYKQLTALTLEGSIKFGDPTFRFADLSHLRKLTIDAECRGIERLFVGCTQLRDLIVRGDLRDEEYAVLPWTTLSYICLPIRPSAPVKAFRAALFPSNMDEPPIGVALRRVRLCGADFGAEGSDDLLAFLKLLQSTAVESLELNLGETFDREVEMPVLPHLRVLRLNVPLTVDFHQKDNLLALHKLLLSFPALVTLRLGHMACFVSSKDVEDFGPLYDQRASPSSTLFSFHHPSLFVLVAFLRETELLSFHWTTYYWHSYRWTRSNREQDFLAEKIESVH